MMTYDFLYYPFFLYILTIGLIGLILVKIAFRHNLWTTIVDTICFDVYLVIVLIGIEGMIILIQRMSDERKKL